MINNDSVKLEKRFQNVQNSIKNLRYTLNENYIERLLLVSYSPYSFQGEESAEFTNTLGENIRVRVCSSIEETSQLLSRVLDGRQSAADLLAKEVHSEHSYHGIGHELLEQVPEDLFNVDNLGIWIDPIGELLKLKKDFFEISTSKR